MKVVFFLAIYSCIFYACNAPATKSSFASYRSPTLSKGNLKLASYKVQKTSSIRSKLANYNAPSKTKMAGCGRFASYPPPQTNSKTHFAAYKSSKFKEAVSLASYRAPGKKDKSISTFGTYQPKKSKSDLTINGNKKSASKSMKENAALGTYKEPKTKVGINPSSFRYKSGPTLVRKSSSIVNSSTISVSEEKKSKRSTDAPSFRKRISISGLFVRNQGRKKEDAFLATHKKVPAKSKRKLLSLILRKDVYKNNYAANDPYRKTKRSKKKKIEKGLFQPGVVKVSDVND